MKKANSKMKEEEEEDMRVRNLGGEKQSNRARGG